MLGSLCLQEFLCGAIWFSCFYLAHSDVRLPKIYQPSQDIQTQRLALERIYDATSGPTWFLDYLVADINTSLASAPQDFTSYFVNQSLSSDALDAQLQQALYSPTSPLTRQQRLKLYELGLMKRPWRTANVSYCSWWVLHVLWTLHVVLQLESSQVKSTYPSISSGQRLKPSVIA